MEDAQIITNVISDGTCMSIKLERISTATIRFTVAKNYQFEEQADATGMEEITKIFCQLQERYIGRIIDTVIRV